MKNCKKIAILSILCIFSVCGLIFSACKKENKAFLNIDKSELILVVGDETAKINADFGNGSGAVGFSSSAENIVSVDESGNLKAKAVGEADIIASYSGISKVCGVTVGLGGMLPALEFEQILESETSVVLGGTLNFAAKVNYDGDSFYDAEITYKSSDAEVGTISQNGIFTPKAIGETEITAEAVWRGASAPTLSLSVKVAVTESVQIYVNDGSLSSFTLYTAGSLDGKTYQTSADFVAYAKENGVSKTCSVAVAQGADIVEYDSAEKKISALKYGDAVITISFAADGGKVQSKDIAIKVLRPIFEYYAAVNFSAADGDLPLTNIFGKEVDLISANDGNSELEVNNNRVTGLTAPENRVYDKRITVYTETVGCTVNLKVYAKILKTAVDLAVLDIHEGVTQSLTGYYLVANDIDASGVAANTHGKYKNDSTANSVKTGFAGIFDGGNHTLKFNAGTLGLFAYLGDNAVVKNIAMEVNFTTVTHSKQTSSVLTGIEVMGANVNIVNVYVNVTGFNAASPQNISFIRQRQASLMMSNVIVENCFYDANKNGGIIFFGDSARNGLTAHTDKFADVYAIAAEDAVITRWGAASYIVAANDPFIPGVANQFQYDNINRYSALNALFATQGAANLPWSLQEGNLVWR